MNPAKEPTTSSFKKWFGSKQAGSGKLQRRASVQAPVRAQGSAGRQGSAGGLASAGVRTPTTVESPADIHSPGSVQVSAGVQASVDVLAPTLQAPADVQDPASVEGLAIIQASASVEVPASAQASVAQPSNGPEPKIQPALVLPTEKVASQKQHRGANSAHNGGVDSGDRNGVTTGKGGIVPSQQRPLNSSPAPSGQVKKHGVQAGHSSRNDKKGTSNEKRPHERLSEVELRFQQEKDRWQDENKQLRARIDHLNNENGILKRDLKTVESLLADAQTLSQVRGEELKGAQVFLTKADALSTADIVQKVTALNNEISQTASRLGELLQNTESPDKTQRQPTELDNWTLGEKLARDLHQLSNHHTEPNPLLVQVIFQIAITTWCSSVVSSWEPNNGPLAESMSSIYFGIRQVEDQAVSGRWRSITRAQLRRSSSNDAHWVGDFVQAVKGILNLAGWSIREADQQQFEKRLPAISKAVQNLRKALGEDVTSMDMRVTTFQAGKTFDPKTMEDSFGDGKPSSRGGRKVTAETVVGTTGLGLLILKGQTNDHETILLPQVALEGVLKEAMKPVSTKAQRTSARRNNTEGRPGTAAGSSVSP